MKKQVFSGVLALSLLLTVIPSPALATENAEANLPIINVTYDEPTGSGEFCLYSISNPYERNFNEAVLLERTFYSGDTFTKRYGVAGANGKRVTDFVFTGYSWAQEYNAQGESISKILLLEANGKIFPLNTDTLYYSAHGYDSIGEFRYGVAAVKNGEHSGAINREGYEIVEPMYDYVTIYEGGMIRADNRYFDSDGNDITPTGCSAYGGFYNGFGSVMSNSGGIGWIDTTGKIIIPTDYSDCKNVFDFGHFILRTTHSVAYADANGNIVDFTDTVAAIYSLEHNGSTLGRNLQYIYLGMVTDRYILIWERGSNGFSYLYDIEMNLYSKLSNGTNVSQGFDGGLHYHSNNSYLASSDFAFVRTDSGYDVVINRQGQMILPDGVYVSGTYSDASKDGCYWLLFKDSKYGIINMNTGMYTDTLYSNITLLADGMGFIVCKDGLYGLLDNDFSTVLPPEFESLKDGSPYNPHSITGKKNGTVYLFDKSGRLIRTRPETAGSFLCVDPEKGLFSESISTAPFVGCFFDSTGKTLLSLGNDYTDCQGKKCGIILTKTNEAGGWGAYNWQKTKEVVPHKYETLTVTDNGYIHGSYELSTSTFPRETRHIIYDTNGNVLLSLDVHYGYDLKISGNYACVTTDRGLDIYCLTGNPSPVPNPDIPMCVTLNRRSLTLEEGQEFTFVPSVTFTDEPATFEWESSAPDIVSIDQNGKITAISLGEATITVTATAGNEIDTATCIVTVANTVMLDYTALDMIKGEKTTLEANIAVTWSSSNDSVATVSDEGLVTAVGIGQAIIVASTIYEGATKSAECIVTVHDIQNADLDEAVALIKGYGSLLYSPNIGEKYSVWQSQKVVWENGEFQLQDNTKAFYLLDKDEHLVFDPAVLIKAEFLQRFNGESGFKNSTRYKTEFRSDQLINENQLLHKIYSQYGGGRLGELINAREAMDIFKNVHHVIEKISGISDSANAFDFSGNLWEDLKKVKGILGDINGLKEDIEKFENEITATEYLYIQASSGILQLEKKLEPGNGTVWNCIWNWEQDDKLPQFISNYYDAVQIETYSLLKAENQQLHPLVFKYLKDKNSWSIVDNDKLSWIRIVPSTKLNRYKSALKSWNVPFPDLRGDTQGKMWFTKSDGPDGKALLALDKSKITDPDFLLVIENIERLENEFLKKIYPVDGSNIISNMELIKNVLATYPEFCQAVSVHCPVDVTVYDPGGNIVAATVNGSIDKAYSYGEKNPLILFADAGGKIIVFPYEKDYKIEVTAYDNGLMQYDEWRFDTDGVIVSETSVQNVPLTSGDTYLINPKDATSAPDYSSLTANAAPLTVRIDASPADNGRVLGGGNYVRGETITLMAIPDDGFAFEGWYENGIKVDNATVTYTFAATDNKSLEARFYQRSTDIHYSIEQVGGKKSTVNSQAIAIIFNQPVDGLLQKDVALDGNTGATIENIINIDGQTWIITLSGITKEGSETLNISNFGLYNFIADSQSVELFMKAPSSSNSSGGSSGSSVSYTLTATAGEGGSINPSGKISVQRNRNKSFAIIPNEGYMISDVLVDGETVGAVTEYTFEKITANHAIEANFKKATTLPAWNPFEDVKIGNWFYNSVKYVYDQNLMVGIDATHFAPDLKPSRAMIITALWRVEGEPKVNFNQSFFDVAYSQWYTGAVAWASKNNLVNGFEDGTFRPDDPITREQIAAILYRYAVYKGRDVTAKADLSNYTDFQQISPYAMDALAWSNSAGLIMGTDWGGLHPGGYATRAEVAMILQRFCESEK